MRLDDDATPSAAATREMRAMPENCFLEIGNQSSVRLSIQKEISLLDEQSPLLGHRPRHRTISAK